MEVFEVLFFFAVTFLSRAKRWLTFRRVLGIVAFLVLLLCLRGLFEVGADLTFVFGLDLGLVTEVSALLIIMTVRERTSTIIYVIKHELLKLKPVRTFLRRVVRRAIRLRSTRPLIPPKSEDNPAILVYALAW